MRLIRDSLLYLAATLGSCLAITDQDQAQYAEIAEVFDWLNVTWEPYQVKTEDGWYLTMFRLTGEVGSQPNYLQEENQDKLPVIMHHPSFQDVLAYNSGGQSNLNTELYIKSGVFYATLPTQLVRRGYDVWTISSRGFSYSNVHERDGEWSAKERWDFSWADMGAFDTPAFIEKVLEVTQKPKVTLTGYSQGSSGIFYGLAKKQDYYAERVNRFVALNPCLFTYADVLPTELEMRRNLMLEQQGMEYYGDDDGEGNITNEQACEFIGGRLCSYTRFFAPSGQNMGALKYFGQLYTTKRFQEPQSVNDWVQGKLSPLVDLGKIDRVPVSILVTLSDTTCTPDQAEFLYSQISSPGKRISMQKGTHTETFWNNNYFAVTRMVNIIEQGSPEEEFASASSAFVATQFLLLFSFLSQGIF